VRRLTDTPENEIYPQWSPDGKQIVFCAIDGGRAFVRAITLDGKEVRTLVEDACHPVWSPDGTRLAYISSARGQPERLWIADPNGQNPTGVAPLEGRPVEKGTLLPRRR
jgi:Tol biopolymer transport system component